MRQAVKRVVAFLVAVGCVSAAYAVSVQTQSIPGGWVWRLAQSTTTPNVMYTAAYTVHRSTDNGRTWVSKPFYTELQIDGEGKQTIPQMYCTRLAVKPNDADTVVAGDINGSGGASLFRTTNGGAAWSALTLPGITGYYGVNVVAASLSSPNNFFAVSVPQGNSSNPGGLTVTKLFKSADAGASWAATGLELAVSDFAINDVLQLPDGTIVAAAANGPFHDNLSTVPTDGTFYRLNSAGVQISSSPVAWAPVRIAWDSTNNRLWATTEAGSAANVYYSADEGLTWTKYTASSLSVFSGDCVPVAVSFFNVAGSTPTLYIGSDSGTGPTLYRSTATADASVVMPPIPLPAQNNGSHMVLHGKVHDILVDVNDPTGKTWLVATTEALYRTENDGVDFVLVDGISNRDTRFGIEDAATGRMCALVFDNNLFYSGDYGATWKKIFPPKDGIQSMMEYVTFHPTDTAKIFVHGDKNIYVTNNNGNDGFNFSSPIVNFGTGVGVTGGLASVDNSAEIKQVVNIIVNPVNPDIMYTGVATLTETATPGHYMYKSSDGGVSWSPVNSLTEHRGIHKLAFDPANPDTLFVCVGSNYGHNPNKDIALYKSTDAAQTWTKLCDFADSRGCMQTFVIDPDNSNNMWVGFFSTASGVYKSEDGGLTWSAMNGPHGAMTQNSRIFYFKPTLYFADGGNIYNSNDRGATWNYVLGVPSMVNWIFEGMTSTTTASAQRRAVSRAGSSTSMIYAASASGLFSISGAAAAGNGGTTTTTSDAEAVKTYAFPNPFNPRAGGFATIKLTLPQGATKATIRIYSLSGELVDETTANNIPADSALNYSWAGRNKNGTLCAPGVYFVVADTGKTKVRNKIVLVY